MSAPEREHVNLAARKPINEALFFPERAAEGTVRLEAQGNGRQGIAAGKPPSANTNAPHALYSRCLSTHPRLLSRSPILIASWHISSLSSTRWTCVSLPLATIQLQLRSFMPTPLGPRWVALLRPHYRGRSIAGARANENMGEGGFDGHKCRTQDCHSQSPRVVTQYIQR